MADSQKHQQKEEQMPPMNESDKSPPATPKAINTHHKTVKGGIGYLLADRYDAQHKPNKFPSGDKSKD